MINDGRNASAAPQDSDGMTKSAISASSREVNRASEPNNASEVLSLGAVGGSLDSTANSLQKDFMNTFPAGALDDIYNDSDDDDDDRMQHLSWEAKYYVSSSSSIN